MARRCAERRLLRRAVRPARRRFLVSQVRRRVRRAGGVRSAPAWSAPANRPLPAIRQGRRRPSASERPARRCSMMAASVSCSPWCHARREAETARQLARAASRAVYPRVCGETKPMIVATAPAHGLSPRVRGNRCVIMTQLGKRRRCACTPDRGTTTTCLAGCRTPCTSGATAPYSRLIAA